MSKHLACLLRFALKVVENEVWRFETGGVPVQGYRLSIQRRLSFINIMSMNALGWFSGELIKLAGR